MVRLTHSIRAVATSLILLACGDASGPGGVAATSDTRHLDAKGDAKLLTELPPAPDLGREITEGVTQSPETGEALPGDFGKSCGKNADCQSAMCIESETGDVCTSTCYEQCPTGWVCKQVPGFGADLGYVCAQPFARLCWPCRTDNECQTAAAPPGSKCISHGDNGSFCSVACDLANAETCPSDYVCQPALSATGATSPQCVPKAGQCACSKRAVALGLETDCHRLNAFGKCVGSRRCESGGLTACTAQTPALELCNGKDDDCNGKTDGAESKDCITWFADNDGDGYGLGAGTCDCNPPAAGYADKGGDCNELTVAINPGKPELCNLQDDDCNGKTDEDGAKGCHDFYEDLDEDGFGGDLTKQCLCEVPPGSGWLLSGGDCDDQDPTISPQGDELCDGIDNDCDGEIDEENAEGCVVYYSDLDQDHFGANDDFKCLCQKDALYVTDQGGDCNDLAHLIQPFAVEICNTQDDNCDGISDNPGAVGCGDFYKDFDEDGYGKDGKIQCLCGATPPYTATVGGDCDDETIKAHPNGNEVCDGIDNDCNGETDPNGVFGCVAYYQDLDNDTYGAGEAKCLCKPEPPYNVIVGGDCNDKSNTVHPAAPETCEPGDENCNGQKEEIGAAGCTNYFQDQDGDGYGVDASQCGCGMTAPFTALLGGDCLDNNIDVHPGVNGWFTVDRGDGSFDWDCDGTITQLYSIYGACGSYFDCDTDVGWYGGAAPACGQSGTFVYDCDWGLFDGCDADTDWRTQQCH